MTKAMATMMDEAKADPAGGDSVEQLLALGGAAYRLAARVLGSREGAEDAVQQAYLEALGRLRQGTPPEDARAWFLRLVANRAKDHLKTEARRRRREAGAMRTESVSVREDRELVDSLRRAMNELESDYRLPVALCCEEGMTQREAAAVLELPESTLRDRLGEGLARLRAALGKAGYAAAPAAVVGALAHTAPAVPATLVAALEKLAASGAMVKSTGAAAVSAAAKGGNAMKIVAGVVAAGVLAGTMAVLPNVFGNKGPGPLAAPPAAAPAEGQPAPINEYKGMQEREEVYEFAQKPAVTKADGKWVIAFTSKGKCDATVSILDKDGVIIRHLASGVLGQNAPYPFQQDSLSQKLIWDGLEDNFKKVDAAGCKVRVSLGLQAKYERNIGFSPHPVGGFRMLLAKAADGTMYALFGNGNVCAYDKDGKYLRTIVPYPAAEVEKSGAKFATTIWGDKVPVGDYFGVYGGLGYVFSHPDWQRTPLTHYLEMFKKEGKKSEAAPVAQAVDFLQSLPGVTGKVNFASTASMNAALQGGRNKVAVSPETTMLPPGLLEEAPGWRGPGLDSKCIRMSVDRRKELLYVGFGGMSRFDGKTGELDKSWFADGSMNGAITEFYPDQDGHLYVRSGGSCYGNIMFCLDRDGKPIPFKKNLADDVKLKEYHVDGNIRSLTPGALQALGSANLGAVFTGVWGSSGTWQPGLHVPPSGLICTTIAETSLSWGVEHGLDKALAVKGYQLRGSYTQVWTPEGDLLTTNAVEGQFGGQNATMDRDGNIYIVQGSFMPAGQKCLDGIADYPVRYRAQGGYGALIKFRGQGGKYPLGKLVRGSKDAPAGAIKFDLDHNSGYATGALWAYGGITGQSGGDCNCNNQRLDQDPWARFWIPATGLFSVMVIDSNGNRIARLGRYGNMDDTEADLKAGKDGIRFAWLRAVAASDTAFYVADTANRRVLKAAISYAAEETVPVP